ncbi:MAG: hypothetical protein FJ388_00445, partial [Verrucomicrobia bacterium]|nr:hypothetical protein [Verrucomicrobiota bacterium]
MSRARRVQKPRRANSRSLTPATTALMLLLTLFFGLFMFYPLGYMFKAALWPEGRFTLELFRLLFRSPFQLECIWN